MKRGLAHTVILVGLGAFLGAATGVACLVLVALPVVRQWPSGYFVFVLYMGTLVGAPLGALGALTLGWSLLRHVPLNRTIMSTPIGTLVGSFVALLSGWIFADVGDGRGIFYLVGGGVIGLLCTAFLLRARYGVTKLYNC